MKLNVRALALAFGVWWGGMLFLLTWWILAFGGSGEAFAFIGEVYFGYSVSPLGSVVGLAWGFVDGLVGGAILAWLYNLLAVRLSPPVPQEGNRQPG